MISMSRKIFFQNFIYFTKLATRVDKYCSHEVIEAVSVLFKIKNVISKWNHAHYSKVHPSFLPDLSIRIFHDFLVFHPLNQIYSIIGLNANA